MSQKDNFIAVFDSGVGGISVLRHLHRLMPNEQYLYFGDSANAPYGTKSRDEVMACINRIMEHLLAQDVKAVVIACNTATAWGLNDIQVMLEKSGTGVKVIGVINAGVNALYDNIKEDSLST